MKKFILIILLAFAAVACDEGVRTDEGSIDGPGGAGSESGKGAQVGAVGDGSGSAGTALSVSYDKSAINDDSSVLAQRVIYFEFDSSNIDEEYVELVKHHGKYLTLNSDVNIRLEGHTDERGTREYNVALADRRAQSIKRLLMFQGVSSNQLTIISYGEEKPVSLGHDEESWGMNRRVELVYQ